MFSMKRIWCGSTSIRKLTWFDIFAPAGVLAKCAVKYGDVQQQNLVTTLGRELGNRTFPVYKPCGLHSPKENFLAPSCMISGRRIDR